MPGTTLHTTSQSRKKGGVADILAQDVRNRRLNEIEV